MTARTARKTASQRRAPRTAPEQLLVHPSRDRRTRVVAFQWHDGAGELHYCTLTRAQSWPFLEKG